MTIIEFFDTEPLENIITCIKNPPDKIYMLGNVSRMKAQEKFLKRFLKKRHGIDVPIILFNIKYNDLQLIYDTIEKIVLENDDCHFDLTGGADLTLVAMGMIFAKYPDRGIQMHRYNILDKQVIDCDQNRIVVSDHGLKLLVKEHIELHGGKIIYQQSGKKYSTYNWVLDDDLINAIDIMWNINKNHNEKWNKFFTEVDLCLKRTEHLAINSKSFNLFMSPAKANNGAPILKELEKHEIIYNLKIENGNVQFTAKNKQIAEILKKAGNILELKIYRLARKMQEEGWITDSLSGVQIDWDGIIHTDEESSEIYHDTVNELDVIIMNGVFPIFISCKNGLVDANECYKLSTVAHKVGGKYVKRILMKTGKFNESPSQQNIKQRMRDLNITLIEGVKDMSDDQIIDELRKIM